MVLREPEYGDSNITSKIWILIYESAKSMCVALA